MRHETGLRNHSSGWQVRSMPEYREEGAPSREGYLRLPALAQRAEQAGFGGEGVCGDYAVPARNCHDEGREGVAEAKRGQQSSCCDCAEGHGLTVTQLLATRLIRFSILLFEGFGECIPCHSFRRL